MNSMFPTLADRRVTVMGLGRFGGGVGVVQFLLGQGARVTLTDLQTAVDLRDSLDQIDVSALDELILGEHQEKSFCETDLVVVNPAVPVHRNPYTKMASAAGVPLTTEINLFWERCRGQKLVVTGTVGKSTTATLINHLLSSTGVSTFLGGNIGVSLLPQVDLIGEEDWVVLELSSFQLAALDRLSPQPQISVITNFSPNHLDWHTSLEEYRAAKQVVLKYQADSDLAVLPGAGNEVQRWPHAAQRVEFGGLDSADESASTPGVRVGQDGFKIRTRYCCGELPFQELPPLLNQPHQRLNVAAAVAAVGSRFRVSMEEILHALKTFQGLPHRLEFLGTRCGMMFVNDSKATTPEATLVALEGGISPITLIAGGKDKGVDLGPLCEAIARRTTAVAFIGDTAAEMAQRVRNDNPAHNCSVHAELRSALEWALQNTEAGGTILLSPGCSSDAQFFNYVERGNRFRQMIEEFTR